MTLFPKFILIYRLPQPIMPWPYKYIKKTLCSFIKSSHLEWLPGPGAAYALPVTSQRIKVKGKQFQKYKELRLLLSLNLSIWEERRAGATRECSRGSSKPARITFSGLPLLLCERNLKHFYIASGSDIWWNAKVYASLQYRGNLADFLLYGVLKTRTQMRLWCYFCRDF